MSELVKNPITIVLAFDAQNCNPNGTPTTTTTASV